MARCYDAPVRLATLLATLLVGAAAMAGEPALEWHAQTSGVDVRLRGVSAVSARVAWASGAKGTVLRTTDAGASFTRLVVPGAEALDFRDVDAFGADVAYVLSIGPGEASRIYKTTDGGSTWGLQLANADPKVFLDAMTFRDATHGVAFSDSVDGRHVVFTTADGGRTWPRVPADRLPPALPDEGAFAASGTNVAMWGPGHVWIGTGASRVLRTSDGGRTWAVATTPLPTGPTAGIFSIAFRDATHGVVVGGDYKKEGEAVDNAAFTTDGGATWSLAKEHGLSGFRSVVAWVPGETSSLLAVGPTGADRSTDGGRTWTPVPSAGSDTLSLAPGGPVGWAAGVGGRVWKLVALPAR